MSNQPNQSSKQQHDSLKGQKGGPRSTVSAPVTTPSPTPSPPIVSHGGGSSGGSGASSGKGGKGPNQQQSTKPNQGRRPSNTTRADQPHKSPSANNSSASSPPIVQLPQHALQPPQLQPTLPVQPPTQPPTISLPLQVTQPYLPQQPPQQQIPPPQPQQHSQQPPQPTPSQPQPQPHQPPLSSHPQPHQQQPHQHPQHPPTNINGPAPPAGPNGYPPRVPNGQQSVTLPPPFVPSGNNFLARTQSAPPNLQEQQQEVGIPPGPMWVPEKSKPTSFYPFYQSPHFHSHMHVPNLPFHLPSQPPPPAIPVPAIGKKPSSRIPIINPNTGEEVRPNSPPKNGAPSTTTTTSTPAPPTTTPTPAPSGLTGYSRPFVPPSKSGALTPSPPTPAATATPAPALTPTSPPATFTPSPSSAPQQVKNVVGGILPELTPPAPVSTDSPKNESKEKQLEKEKEEKEREKEKEKEKEREKEKEQEKEREKEKEREREKEKEREREKELEREKEEKEKREREEKEKKAKEDEKEKERKEKEAKKEKAKEGAKQTDKPDAASPADKHEKSQQSNPPQPQPQPQSQPPPVENKPEEKKEEPVRKNKKHQKEILKKADEGKHNAADFDPYRIEKDAPKKDGASNDHPKAQDVEKESPKEPDEAPPEEVAEDDWDKKDLDNIVVPKKEDVILRPGGGKPGLGESTKKMYDRNFLLQFQSLCTDRPVGLPTMEVILGYDEGKGGQYQGGSGPGGKRPSVSGPPGLSNYPPNARGGFQARPRGGKEGYPMGRKGPVQVNKMGGKEALLPFPPPAPLPRKENVWTPYAGANDSVSVTLKKAKGLLNKITLDKFDALTNKLLDVGISSAEILKGVIHLVFEKALSEPKYVNMYAQLCQRISISEKIPVFTESDQVDGKPITFKRILLNKCQEEFEVNQLNANKKERREEGMTPEQILEIEEKEYRARKSYLGELFKLDMLTEKIMHTCVARLLGDVKNPKVEDMEALCKLMSTIGERLDHQKAQNHMVQYFVRIKEISQNSVLPSRIRFMLEDLIELRKSKWVPRRDSNAPKTIKEVHKEAAEKEKEKEKEYSRMRTQPPIRTDPRNLGGRPPDRLGPVNNAPPPTVVYQQGGRGNPPPRQQQTQDGWKEVTGKRRDPVAEPPARRDQEHTILAPAGGQPGKGWASAQQGGDKSKQDEKLAPRNTFSALAAQPTPTPTLQPPPPNKRGNSPPPALTAEQAESQATVIFEEFQSSRDGKEAGACIKELNAPALHADIISAILTNVLEKKENDVRLADSLFDALRDDNVVTAAQLGQGFQKILAYFSDLVVDLPKAPKFMGIIVGGAISRNQLPLQFLHDITEPLVTQGVATPLVFEIFDVIQRAPPTPQTEAELWAVLPRFFSPPPTESQIITTLVDKKMSHLFPLLVSRVKIDSMLKDGNSADSILKWIEENVPDIDNKVEVQFVRGLVRTVLKKITASGAGVAAQITTYSPLLKRFLSEPDRFQLPSLFETQDYWATLGAPKKLLSDLFSGFYDQDVIMEETFQQWADDTKDTTPKKEEALESTKEWRQWLKNAQEESDDEDKA